MGRRPIGKFIDYLWQSRPFADKIYGISHNSRGYDIQFLLRKFLELRCTPQLIMDDSKILSMVVENMHIIYSLKFLPMNLKSMPNSFDLTFKKGYYPHCINTANNFDYVGQYPKLQYYGSDCMSGYKRA